MRCSESSLTPSDLTDKLPKCSRPPSRRPQESRAIRTVSSHILLRSSGPSTSILSFWRWSFTPISHQRNTDTGALSRTRLRTIRRVPSGYQRGSNVDMQDSRVCKKSQTLTSAVDPRRLSIPRLWYLRQNRISGLVLLTARSSRRDLVHAPCIQGSWMLRLFAPNAH
jgi:hypothetical protein